jgi:hypothetical protein
MYTDARQPITALLYYWNKHGGKSWFVVWTPDHQFSLKVVDLPLVKRIRVSSCAANIGKFVVGHQTLKSWSEICWQRATKLCQIYDYDLAGLRRS